MEIKEIYQDEHLLVVNKPNNILVHPSFYARNIDSPSLVELLKIKYGDHIYSVHRLDHKTSGLLIFAKTAEIARIMQQQFLNHSMRKTYHAIVRGFAPCEGIITSPVKNPASGIYKDALTNFTCLSQIEVDIPVQPYAKSRYSYLELQPHTGRMHQLRKHMNKINHPIIGDNKYGNRHHNHMFQEKFNQWNLFLHAYQLEFEHPIHLVNIKLTAPIPQNWHELAGQLKWDFPPLYI